MAGSLDPPSPIRVLVVDDHPVIRGVLRLAFESAPNLEVAGECGTAEAAVEICRAERPDVMVVEMELPDQDGVALIRRIREDGYRGKVIVLTTRNDGATILECLRAGVDGYLEKAHGLRTIGSSVMRVVMGERVIDPELEQVAVMELGRFARRAREGSEIAALLTPREAEILRFVSEGLTMRQIASRLAISPRTVETHVAKLYRKLGVRTRLQAVAKAVQLGLIDL